MDSPPQERFYTSFADCIHWSVGALFIAVASGAAVLALSQWMDGRSIGVSLRDACIVVAGTGALGIILGTLLFIFGWMGRVAVSRDGIRGPRYSGFHDFVPWEDIQGAASGSLSGWPCSIIVRKSDKPSIYLMVIGRRRKALVLAIGALAPVGNPLLAHVQANVG